MDFLDPKKQRAHMIRLIVGYVLIGIAILIATVILLYRAYGFGFGKDGEVIQNGLVFVSSQPGDAEIYINGVLKKNRTNTKLQLPEGAYTLELRRDGYRDWQRAISLGGGTIEHFDYPLLFPANMTQTKVKAYDTRPSLITQSPDHRWLLVQQSGASDTVANFDIFDLNDPENLTAKATSLAVPENILTSARSTGQSWKLMEWSTDNRRLILEHIYSDGSEYILIDREDPEASVNLTKTLGLTAGQLISLHDKKFDKYYIFDPTAKQVKAATLNDGVSSSPVLSGVLAFKPYGDDELLYTTADGVAEGKVATMLREGDTTYKIHEHSAQGPYLLDMARFDGNWYVVVGSSGDNKLYVYRNPQAVRRAATIDVLIPVQVLKVTAPTYVAFSTTAQFVIAENGTSFATYDVDTARGYRFTATQPLDAPAEHATWMDGNRLTYISGGKLVVMDYDNQNVQTLTPAVPGYLPFFDRSSRFVYTITTESTPTSAALSSASLLIPEDQ